MRTKISKNRVAVYSDYSVNIGPVVDINKALRTKDMVLAGNNLQIPNAGNTAIERIYENTGAKLDFASWLPFAAKAYGTSQDIRDYLLRPYIIMPTILPNRNGFAFPTEELVSWHTDAMTMRYKMWKGSPTHLEHCFIGDTSIRTSKGLEKIKNVKVGDYVLTHTGKYQKVITKFNNGVKHVKRIDAQGLVKPIYATNNHPMYVVGRGQVCGTNVESYKRLSIPEQVTPHFRPVSDIYNWDYLVVKLDIGGTIKVKKEFAFLTGVYMAEGNLNPSNKAISPNSVCLTLGYYEKALLNKVKDCCEILGLEYKVSYGKDKGVCVVVIKDKDFSLKMKQLCGSYSHLKSLKGELREWNNFSYKHFLAGYISGDGSVNKHRVRCVTVSENLAQDIQLVFGKLGMPASVNSIELGTAINDRYTLEGTKRKNTSGKPYQKERFTYTVGVSRQVMDEDILKLVCKKSSKCISSKALKKEVGPRMLVIGEYLLLPIVSIQYSHKEKVYNLEVENDHTYIANSVVVHNCNEDPTIANGIVADSLMLPMKGYGGGKLHRIVVLMALDRTRYPTLTNRVLNGELNSVSMGAWANSFTCSKCGADVGNCKHLALNNPYQMYVDEDNELVYRNVRSIQPFEVSWVSTPAYSVAVNDAHLLNVKE